MGHRGRHVRQQLGLAIATGLMFLLSVAVPGSAPEASASATAAVRTPGPEFRLARLAYTDNPNLAFGGFRGSAAGPGPPTRPRPNIT